MTDEIHSCSYYCERPACVRAQRDYLRDKYITMPVLRTTTIGTSDNPIEVWVGTAEPPEVLPRGPSCCCTDPPTKMGLTFYMDSTVGPVQRVDATCPACGAMVKGLKL